MAAERWDAGQGEKLARNLLDRIVERNADDYLFLWSDEDWDKEVGRILNDEAGTFVDGDAFRCLVAWATEDCPDAELFEFPLVRLVAGAIRTAIDYGF